MHTAASSFVARSAARALRAIAHSPRRRGAAAIALLAGVLGAGSADANLIANGLFDTDLLSWTGFAAPANGGSFAFDATLDADARPASGSLRTVNTGAPADSVVFVRQCVAGVTAGKAYYARTRIRYETEGGAVGLAYLAVAFFPQANCSGSEVGSGLSTKQLFASNYNSKLWLDSNEGDITAGVTAPPGAQSARIVLENRKETAGGSVTVNFDRAFFAPVGEPLCNGLAPTIGGTDGPDTIVGTSGPDVIVGMEGDDKIYGKGGNDVICGGPGNDVLLGGGGNDELFGGTGNDTLRGGMGDDQLYGGAGDDHLFGGADKDQLDGGVGADTCSGGAGSADSATGSCEVVSSVP